MRLKASKANPKDALVLAGLVSVCLHPVKKKHFPINKAWFLGSGGKTTEVEECLCVSFSRIQSFESPRSLSIWIKSWHH